MRQKALTLSLVVICTMALVLCMWAVALAEDTTTTTTTGNGESTTTSEGGDTTTSSTEPESTTSTSTIDIVQVTPPVEGAVPTFLAAAEGRIAWTGVVPGSYSTMYLYNTSTLVNIKIPAGSPGPYYNPDADGPWVVYQGGRAGAYSDIWAYDTGNGLVKRITNNADPGDGEDWNPRIHNNRIVWEKHTSSALVPTGIYVYDLNGGMGTKATLLFAGNEYHDPDIWGDWVVCVKNATGGGSEIILHNLKTTVTLSLPSTGDNNERPRIDSGYVVWSSGDAPVSSWYPWSTYQIELYDIAKSTTQELTDNGAGNSNPSIEGDIIAWQQREPSSIQVYDRPTETMQEFAVSGEIVESPDVDGDVVAFLGSKGLYYVRLSGTSVSSPFLDVPLGHPYLEAIATMSMYRIIAGYEDGRFGPGDLVTRQQFAKMIVLTMAEWNPAIFTPTFSDRYNWADTVEKVEGELYPYHYVAKAALTGLTRGYPDNTFRPLNNISRQQVISMVVRAGAPVLETPPPGWQGQLSYLNPVHGENIRIAEYNGILDGIYTLRGNLVYWSVLENATRGEVAQILYNLLGKLLADLE